ncbi:sulfatase-like hydrolase/transferase [Candidatus Poribacteria bacterium]|nr:sulfatase-like hydrolase/transferase [Candidatus Poribacteria bacterium]
MRQPNFVFILIDDLGWKDLACCGSEFYLTPNLDKLRDEGVRFTNAYASCPVCSPTRASIMTGKYPATVGVTNYIAGNERGKVIGAPYTKHLPLEEKSLASALKDGGYNTWHVGKWHLGGEPYWPEKHGFDINVAGCHWGMPSKGYFSPWGNPKLEDGPEGEYLTDRLTDEAIKLIENNDGNPFYLNMCYYSVHIPIQAKQDRIEKHTQRVKDMGLDKEKTFEEGEFFPCEHKKDRHVIRRLIQSDPKYAAMIDSLDENIGRLIKAIEDSDQKDNTVIVFTSDNGGLATAEGSPTCNAPLSEGKGWMYEGGTREPLLISWPEVIEPGSTCDIPVTSPDFYPTFLEIAGLDLIPQQHCDGVSILPLLKGNNSLDRDAIFWHYPHYGNQGGSPGCSVRCGDYKLIEFFEDGKLELYNLVEDEKEDNNLAQDMPQKTKELHEMLVDWRESVNARIPEPNPDYNRGKENE